MDTANRWEEQKILYPQNTRLDKRTRIPYLYCKTAEAAMFKNITTVQAVAEKEIFAKTPNTLIAMRQTHIALLEFRKVIFE